LTTGLSTKFQPAGYALVKYRGSQHGTNEYPFLIDEEGISVLPVTSLKLEKEVSSNRTGISSGIPALDEVCLAVKVFLRQQHTGIGHGRYRQNQYSIAYFANETCNSGNRCLYFAFEESPRQIIRNMKSINVDLQKHVDNNLQFYASRPTLYGLEMHLVAIYKLIKRFKPSAIVLDPITNLITVGSVSEVKSMLIRLIDFLQEEQITVMFTALTLNTIISDQTDEGVSSLVDAWLLVRDIEFNGERNRGMYIMKSRGMKHSNQVREFIITDKGSTWLTFTLAPKVYLPARHGKLKS
jgi:circadian clock protein KaiC